MDKKYCPYCMTCIEDGGDCCPNCQLTNGSYRPKSFHIPPGSVLRDRYFVGKVIGEGGFGITYIGRDLVLDRKIAIKEYFPRERVNRVSTQSLNVEAYFGEQGRNYESGKKKFLDEARVMAMLTKEPAIVRVQDFFEDNNTAYIVMEYIEGTTLSELVDQKGGKIPPEELFTLIEPLFKALQTMHDMEFVHRDISPDNIMIERGQVRLLDFGCAREAVSKTETLSIMLKPGYAPIEQYQQYGQGPWTDVYALCATIYFCLTGTKPPLSVERMIEDKLVRPKKLGVSLSEQQENALLAGLRVVPGRRTQSIKELHANLYQNIPVSETGSLTVSSRIIGSDSGIPDIRFVIKLSGKDVNPDATYGDAAFRDGLAEVTVKGGSSIVLPGIPIGTSYKVTGSEIEDFHLVNSSHAEGTIEKNASRVAAFDYKSTLKPTGSLVISSKMKRPASDTEQSVLKYTVTLSGDSVDLNGTYGDIDFTDGRAEIELSDGDSTVLSGIPAGTGYTVIGGEFEGYNVLSSKTEGIIDSSSSKNVRFTYKPIKEKKEDGDENGGDMSEKPIWSVIIAIALIVIVISVLAMVFVPKLLNGSREDNPTPDDSFSVTADTEGPTDGAPTGPPSPAADYNGEEHEHVGEIYSLNVGHAEYCTICGRILSADSYVEPHDFSAAGKCKVCGVKRKDIPATPADGETWVPISYGINEWHEGDEASRTARFPVTDIDGIADWKNMTVAEVEEVFDKLSHSFTVKDIVDRNGQSVILDDKRLQIDTIVQLYSVADDLNYFIYHNWEYRDNWSNWRDLKLNIDWPGMRYQFENNNVHSAEPEDIITLMWDISIPCDSYDEMYVVITDSEYDIRYIGDVESKLKLEHSVDLTETAWPWFAVAIEVEDARIGDTYGTGDSFFQIGNSTKMIKDNDPTRTKISKDTTADYSVFPRIYLSPLISFDTSVLPNYDEYYLEATYSYRSIIFRAEGYNDIIIDGSGRSATTCFYEYDVYTNWLPEQAHSIAAELQAALKEKGINIEEFITSYYPAVYDVSIYGLSLDSLIAYPKGE